MITIQIDEKKMREMLSQSFKEHIEDILNDSNLEYWVRTEVHKLLSKEIFEKKVKGILTDEKINELLKRAFDDYIYQKLDKD